MLILLAKGCSAHDGEMVRAYLKEHGYTVRESAIGEDRFLSASGKGTVDVKEIGLLPGVERVAETTKPYELVSRDSKGKDSIVRVGPVKIGGARISVIAGPCAVESREQILETALRVRESGAVILRGGAFKPRTSPYAFQGLGMRGLEFMKEAGETAGMPIVTEVVSPELADEMKDLVDMFQIGARNMQNFELLKRVGAMGKPVLLKRGPSATIEEWLLSAEYLLAAGTVDVVLCERGIRTFETYTRNTLDISAIPVVKRLSHLPVIVDPSHAVGIRAMVSQAALAAVAAGADGLTVEVHPNPDAAMSDGPQSLIPDQFEKLMRDVEALAPVVGKELLRLPRMRRFAERLSVERQSERLSVERQAAEAIGPKAGTIPGAPFGALPIAGPLVAGQWLTEGQLIIAFCGEAGAFAEQALERAFGEDAPRLHANTFRAAFDAVLEGKAAFAVIPVENSLAGSLHEIYDLFLSYPDIAIVGELKLRIVHCLIGAKDAKLEDIRTVRSHPQGFAQCREFLDKYPHWRLETWNNTASAALSIAEAEAGAQEAGRSIAAIASEQAAGVHGLAVLKAGIETNPQNYTRFVIIARKPESGKAPLPPSMGEGKPNKASLVFSVHHETGSLFSCLKILSEQGVNLSKLESRPILGKPWRYLFYVDAKMPEQEGVFEAAMDALALNTEDFRLLGAYREAL
jgi:3-deoxy-7-phosphoheptulonate synthase